MTRDTAHGMETKLNMPKDIVSSGEQIFDIAFHPTDNVLATATITGTPFDRVYVYV